MFGAKISLIKNRFFWKTNLELFQSTSKGEIGAVDTNNNWKKNIVMVRKTVSIGRLKWYGESGEREGEMIKN